MMDVEGIEVCNSEPQSSDSDGLDSIAVFMQDYLIHDELRERDVWEDITYFMGYIRTYDPVEEEERAKMKAETIREYLTERYAKFHDISEQESAEILYGCGALDGYYEEDMAVVGHLNMCRLISMLRYKVKKLGGANPPAILPRQMGYETVTELLPR